VNYYNTGRLDHILTHPKVVVSKEFPFNPLVRSSLDASSLMGELPSLVLSSLLRTVDTINTDYFLLESFLSLFGPSGALTRCSKERVSCCPINTASGDCDPSCDNVRANYSTQSEDMTESRK
jgi:hypothetical protein